MGVDCVFYIRVPEGQTTREVADKLAAEIAKPDTAFPGFDPHPDECEWRTQEQRVREVVKGEESDDGYVHRIKPSLFAYCYVAFSHSSKWVTVHDGCRKHLNVETYQASMMQWLDTHMDCKSFVLGDNDDEPQV